MTIDNLVDGQMQSIRRRLNSLAGTMSKTRRKLQKSIISFRAQLLPASFDFT